MSDRRRVVYISGTRADFGLMRSTLQKIAASPDFDLSVLLTGMHLSAAYGATEHEVEEAGLVIAARVPVPEGEPTGATMARNLGIMVTAFSDVLHRLKPDIVLVLGDRAEMLAGAIVASHLGITLVHIHGGERSGTIDEPVRHAISKFANFHFVATQESAARLARMGEDTTAIHVVGAPGLDGLSELATIDRETLFAARGLVATRSTALVLFHPVLSEARSSGEQMAAILDALAEADLQVLALRPNSDAGSAAIAHLLEERAKRDGFTLATHLPRSEFLSYLRHIEVLVGNSSSGIIEAATFGTPVVNIGSRQNLRQRNTNVYGADTSAASIVQALRSALAAGRDSTRSNVYGDGRAGERIIAQLSRLDLSVARMGKTNAY